VKKFSLLSESSIANFKKNTQFSRFDMSKLEVEYDYDTENEQITQSQRMLATDLKDAIDWFVAEDPLQIVSNIATYY